MKNQEKLLHFLRELGIEHTLHAHAPVRTIEDCLRLAGLDFTDTVMPRNAFVCNRQRTDFYLMLLRPHVPFRTALVSKALCVSRLSFAPEALLPGLLGLEAGAVSPLGLLFDTEKRVTLAMDEGLLPYEKLAFHPCRNTATVVMRRADFLSVFLPALGRVPRFVGGLEEG